MENLSRIAQGIFLGNGEVWNFLDYAVNRNCGGLLYKTQQLDLLDSNFTNNFNGGHKRKYDYEGEDTDNIPTFNAYSINPLTGKIFSTDLARNTVNSLYPIHGRGGNLGDLYTVPEFSSNSALKFITKENFEALEKQIRDDQTSSNGLASYKNSDGKNEEYKSFSLESYDGEVSDEYKPTNLSSKGLGDDVDIQYIQNSGSTKKYTLLDFGEKAKDVSDGYQKVIKDKIYDKSLFPGIYPDYSTKTVESYNGEEAVSLSEDRYKVRKINEDGRIYKKLKPLLSVASGKRELWEPKERKLLTNNFEGSLNPNDKDKVTVNTKNYGDVLIDTKYSKLSDYIDENNGLYEYYNDERKKYKSPIDGIRNPWGRKSWWNNEDSYGVEFNERGQEYYSVNEENKYKGEVPISSKYNGGEQTTYNVSKGARSYSFYEEAEKGAVPTELETSVSDGSSVLLDTYSNSSRLLEKTNQLFKDAKIGSLINRFHTNGNVEGGEFITAYNETYGMSRGRNLLKANGVTNTGYEDPYCRVWTAHHQYSKLKDRIRPFVDDNGKPKSLSETQSNYGLMRPDEGLTRLNDYSVLGADGFVKITPTHDDNGKLVQEADKLKNYMFSIENLAWRDVTKNKTSKALSKEQRGPNGGRIMWFPPYNLKFSENVNVNWNANSFIGRGEEIYTYTNTVRSGTLDFTLLIDHPSILNKWRGQIGNVFGEEKKKREEDILRFFAGCGNLNDVVTAENPSKEDKKSTEEVDNRETKPASNATEIAYVIFFPNDFSAQNYMDGNITIGEGENAETKSKIKYACENILESYNTGGTFDERDKSFQDEVLQPHNLTSYGFSAAGSIETIRETLFNGDKNIVIKTIGDLIDIKSNFTGDKIYGHSSTTCKIQKVTVKGFASSHGYPKNNEILRNRRRLFIQKAMEEYCQELSSNNVKYVFEEGYTVDVKDIDGRADVNTLKAKLARAAYAIVSIEWDEENVTYESPDSNNVISVYGAQIDKMSKNYEEPKTIQTNMSTSVTYSSDEYTYDNEYLYFSQIKGDQMVYKNIVDKVKYFDPAFHSVTPEGFNARLTFLHQCTRQGPTNAVTSGRVKGKETDESGNTLTNGSPDYLKFAGNLSFGRAPYCILRIGDFFNTKICIDSMSINYDNNGGVQWDLNPEGVGVQPMYANISISFKFLGGQDITKPIERLQNAVTANYYANASVYSRHADNNKFYFDALEDHANLTD